MLSEDKTNTWNILPGSQKLPLIIAHRGDLSRAPENTIAAFRQAISAGADGIELDVRLTRDGELVVFRDRTLDRTSSGRGLLDHSTLAEIQSLDVGSWYSTDFAGETAPTLDQVFESLPHDFLINVEMKVVISGTSLIAKRVAEAVTRHQRWDSTLVASFNPIALIHLRRMEPRISRAYIFSRNHPYPIRARWFSPLVKAHWYDPAEMTYSSKVHRKFQQQGCRVLAWDLDFDQDLSEMASVGLEAVVTNNLSALVERKQELALQMG